MSPSFALFDHSQVCYFGSGRESPLRTGYFSKKNKRRLAKDHTVPLDTLDPLPSTTTAGDLAEVRRVLPAAVGWNVETAQGHNYQWIAVDAPDGTLWGISRAAGLFQAMAHDTSADLFDKRAAEDPWPLPSEAEKRGTSGLVSASFAAEAVRGFVAERNCR